MTLKFQGKWEAERIARIVNAYANVEPAMAAWCNDASERIMRQVESTRKYFQDKGKS